MEKKKIIDEIGYILYRNSGYHLVNATYYDMKRAKLKQSKKTGLYTLKGIYILGKDDVGDGESWETNTSIEVIFSIINNNIKIVKVKN